MNYLDETSQLAELPAITSLRYSEEISAITSTLDSLEQAYLKKRDRLKELSGLPSLPADKDYDGYENALPQLVRDSLVDLDRLRERAYLICKTSITEFDQWKNEAYQAVNPYLQEIDKEVMVAITGETDKIKDSFAKREFMTTLSPLHGAYTKEQKKFETIMRDQLYHLGEKKEEIMSQLQVTLRSFSEETSSLASSNSELSSSKLDEGVPRLAKTLKTMLATFGDQAKEVQSFFLSLLDQLKEQEIRVRRASDTLKENARQHGAASNPGPAQA